MLSYASKNVYVWSLKLLLSLRYLALILALAATAADFVSFDRTPQVVACDAGPLETCHLADGQRLGEAKGDGIHNEHAPMDSNSTGPSLRISAASLALTRRDALAGVTATGLAGLTGVAAVPLMTGSTLGQTVEHAPHRIALGQVEVIVISDGPMEQAPALMLPDRDDAAVGSVFQREGAAYKGFNADNKCAVIKTGRDVILVDAGAGPDFMPALGRLHDNLGAAGINPEAITKVVFTHAHADHFWGVTDPLGGDTLYEKAEHLMSEADLAFWQRADVVERHAEPFRGMAMGTVRRMKPLLARLKSVKPGAEIAAGVALVDTAGHTPGHVSVLVRSGTEQLLIGGDALVQSVISFAEPGWRWGPDMDPDQAVATRRRVLDMLAVDRIQLLGFHFPWPGAGRVEKKGTAHLFVAG